MTYQEKLKNPKWQKKRLQILERDNFKCQSCGSDKNTLHVHHRFYKKGLNPWEYPDISLLTLCEDCHKEEEAKLQERGDELIQKMREANADSFHIGRLAGFFSKLSMGDNIYGNEVYEFLDILYAAYYLKSIGNTEIHDIVYDINYNRESKRVKHTNG